MASAVSFLVWNPHAYEYKGPLELEANLDYRPIMAYTNKVDRLPIELCGPGKGACRFVAASVDGNRAVLPLAATGARRPTRVRFCWGPSPFCNLSDASGLPVGPFELPLR